MSAEESKDQGPEAANRIVIVAIGASAGGLEALKELVSGLRRSDSLTYVVAQHLSPTHTSLLRDLLKPGTELTLRDLSDRLVPQPNTIYITPPNHDVEFSEGALRLVRPRASVGPKPSVDHFFTSLAENYGENTVGIVLSGTGSDGALGVRAIKAAGGIALVQDPLTAKFDGMPKAAIQTGSADMIAAPLKMGEILEGLVALPPSMRVPLMETDATGASARINSYVKRHTGFDLSHYKSATVARRIARRMALHRSLTPDDYAELLKTDREEAQQLAKDVLISVTAFFRDPQSFEHLRNHLETIVQSRGSDNVVRIWVPACATGEEAYGIAMMLSDIIRERNLRCEFLIFATDLDGDALGIARTGSYPDSAIAQLPKGMRDRYFDLVGRSYQVKKGLRQSMVFAQQNVIEDPPFSRVDLISCRNLLIYFNRDVQRRVLEIFHYALRAGGLLFLGKSESIELHRDLFDDLDKRARIFSRRETSNPTYAVPLRGRRAGGSPEEPERRGGPEFPNLSHKLLSALAERYCPPAVVIDEQDEVIHFIGELRPFLRFPRGAAEAKIYDLAPDAQRGELRALVHRCRRERQPQTGTAFTLENDESRKSYVTIVSPIEADRRLLISLSFEPAVRPLHTGAIDNERGSERDTLVIDELEKELASTRQHLQTVVEELETSNEELLSQSEELQSANEELQSTNEEMQTSNEELQSTNEELLTVNDELQSKSLELSRIAADLQSVKESLDFPLLVVDERLHLKHFNRAASQLLPKDTLEPDMSLSSIDWHLDMVGLLPRIRDVIKTGRTNETTLQDDQGRAYIVRLMPTASMDGEPPGGVVVFSDVSQQAATERALREREALYRLNFELSAVGMAMLDHRLQFLRVNGAICRILGWSESELFGKTLLDTVDADSASGGRKPFDELMSGSRTSLTQDLTMSRRDGNKVNVILNAVVVGEGTASPMQIAIQMVDITASKLRQAELQKRHARLQLEAELVSLSWADGDDLRVMRDGSRMVAEYYQPLRITAGVLDERGLMSVIVPLNLTAAVPVGSRVIAPEAVRELTARLVESAGAVLALSSEDSSRLLGNEHPGTAMLVAAMEEGVLVGFVVVDEPPGTAAGGFDRTEFRRAAELMLLKFKEARAASARTRRQQSMLEQKARFETALGSIGDGIITVNPTGLVDYINSAGIRLTGVTSQKAAGRPIEEVFRLISGEQEVEVVNPVRRCLSERRVIGRLEHTSYLVRGDGRRFVVQCSAAPFLDGSGKLQGAILIFRDLTEQGLLAEELSFRASHDPLTGLLNRDEFERRMRIAMNSVRNGSSEHVLCLLNVDRLHVINQAGGREIGDEMLRQIAQLIATRRSEDDLIARIGGDEFGIMFANIDMNAARTRVDTLRKEIASLRYEWNDTPYSVTASCGVVEIAGPEAELSHVWSRAESAKRAAKDAGRDRAYFADQDEDAITRRMTEMQFVSRLSHALDQNLFRLVTETVRSLKDPSQTPLYRECLLRPLEGNGFEMNTAELVSAAERYFMIGSIDRWVIRTLLRGKVVSEFAEPVAINMSGQTISESQTLPFLMAELEASGFPPERLIIEITETAAVSQLNTAVQFMTRLKERGVRFALDDFGSGMASLAYLRKLPVDFLKIDGALVSGLGSDGLNRTLVSAVAQIGREMGIAVIAERVDDSGVGEALQQLGIVYGQGYLFDHPVGGTPATA